MRSGVDPNYLNAQNTQLGLTFTCQQFVFSDQAQDETVWSCYCRKTPRAAGCLILQIADLQINFPVSLGVCFYARFSAAGTS